MTTALEPEVDWADILDQPPLCTITEIRQCPHGARMFVPCDKPADFQVASRCAYGHDTQRLVCFDHEDLIRQQPQLVYCFASHPAIAYDVQPLGGA